MHQQQHPLDELFPAAVSSPYPDQMTAMPFLSSAHKSVLLNQLHQQKRVSPIKTNIFSPKNDQQLRVLSPIKTNIFSPKNDHPLLWSALDASLPEKISPWNVEPLSPLNSRSAFPNLEKQQESFRSLSSRQLVDKLSDGLESKVSRVESRSKESPSGRTTAPAANREVSVEGSNSNSPSIKLSDNASFLAWNEQLQLDKIMA
ncbi:hypothetical protein DITRI_Ditri14bG0014700 [Diplodiscus trichospermus]